MTDTPAVPVSLPSDVVLAARAEADRLGVSLERFVALTLAARLDAEDREAGSYTARVARASLDRARSVLARAGTSGRVRPDDRLDAPDD
jgi:hypothetical protein